MTVMRVWMTLVLVLTAVVATERASARPARLVTTDPALAEQRLNDAAANTLKRLPTCELTIQTRVAEWKASALIACKKSSGAVDACVAAQWLARADQLQRLRSCKFLYPSENTMSTSQAPLTLVSHLLCPYVQRAAIVLLEKGVPFERKDIDLANKPEWFLKLSPLGKTPVLLVGDQPIFESAVICEYLDETLLPRLHPQDALRRAQHRAWIEFGSTVLATIWTFYTTADEATLQTKATELRAKLALLEPALSDGPYFEGASFSIVDAVFGPVFRYFDVFETLADFAFFEQTPKVRAWRAQLAARPSVQQAVRADYADLLKAFVAKQGSALSKRIAP